MSACGMGGFFFVNICLVLFISSIVSRLRRKSFLRFIIFAWTYDFLMHNSNYAQMVIVMQELEHSAPFVDMYKYSTLSCVTLMNGNRSNSDTDSDDSAMSPGNVTFLGQMFLCIHVLCVLEHFIHPLNCVIVFAYAHKQFVSLVSSIMLRRKKQRLINCIKRLCECVRTYTIRTPHTHM